MLATAVPSGTCSVGWSGRVPTPARCSATTSSRWAAWSPRTAGPACSAWPHCPAREASVPAAACSPHWQAGQPHTTPTASICKWSATTRPHAGSTMGQVSAKRALITTAPHDHLGRAVSVSTGEQLSTPARVAELGEGISEDELQLASRNHGMPLEAMRYDVTPPGLHYLLIHYDIPAVDPDTWRLRLTGLVEHPLVLDLDTIRARPRTTLRVTMECAGNGRARLVPRPISQPWLNEAVGTAEWTGTPLAPLLEKAEVESGALEVVFTGADRGVQGGVEQDYERSLTLEEAMRPEVLLVYDVNGQPLPPQHGSPVRLLVPGWYGMTSVKWLRRITVITEPFQGYQQVESYRFKMTNDEPGDPVTRIYPRSLMVPPGIPVFLSRERVLNAGPVGLQGRAWSGWGSIERVEV